LDASVLEASCLTKSFGRITALREASFAVAPGELLAVIGPSGCGKSTLLRCLNFLEIPDSGTVRIAGLTVQASTRWTSRHEADAHRLRAECGMVFQGFHLFPHLSVLRNVMLAPCVVKRLPRDHAAAEAEALLRKVGLGNFLHARTATLSGGQQQRAAIARALAMRPRVMLYDEPTSALDPELAHEVLQVMHALHADGIAQVVVTHELRFARAAADRILYMEAGEIVECAPPDRLFGAPRDQRTQRFLSRLQ
jgi:polar amino acid transport system ATP-binding protein